MVNWIRKKFNWKWLLLIIPLLALAGIVFAGGIDDTAFGVGTSRINEQACLFDDTTPDSVDEGDKGIPRMSANRCQYFMLRDAAGNERGVNVTSGNAAEIDIAEQSLSEVAIDLDEVLGTSTNVNGGNRDAGTQTVTLADDDPATVSLGIIDNTIIVDDAGFAPATTSVNMAGFEFDDTTPDSVDEGDAGAARMSANRNIYFTLRDAAGNERGANITTGNALEIDIAEQSLTAVKISDDTSANAVGNPIYAQVSATAAANLVSNPLWMQLSQDGSSAVDATHPVPVSATLAANAVGNPMYVSVSKDTSANATANRIWVTSNMDQVAGNGTNTNGGNRDTGTQTVTLADNDPAVVALQVLDNAIIVDDAGFTPATSSVSMMGCEFDDTTPDSVDEGDGGAVRMSANRNMYTTIRDAAGNERGVNVTTGNAMEIDIAEQSLTAVKVSATAAANLVSNPIWTQLSQDGSSAMDATHPIAVSPTLAANAVGNPFYSAVSKDTSANATANRIWVTADMDMVAGTATNVNGGTINAGTQTITIATDDEINDDIDAIKTSVELIDNAYTAGTTSLRTEEIDPLDQKLSSSTLADVTNGADATYYYYVDKEGYRYEAVQGTLDGGSGTITITIECSIQDDGTAQASCSYVDVTSDVAGVASWTATFLFTDNDQKLAGCKYVRYKAVAATGAADDADWTLYHKKWF